MSRPWYMSTSPDFPVDTGSSPSSSFVNLVPEAVFGSANPGRRDVSPVSVDRANLWRTIEWVPDHLTPLNKYVCCLERHERISSSLAVDTRCQEPFLDYIPCPGSGPLSAAGSKTSEYARQPGTAYIPALVQPSTPAPFLVTTASPDRPTTPTHVAPIMMRRYLEDDQEPNWIPTMLGQPYQSPSPPEETQVRRSLDEAPPLTTQLPLSRHAHPEYPPSTGQCLGKRVLPDWDSEFALENHDILTPDDEADSKTL